MLPSSVSLLIAGRSVTVTTRMSPWRSRRTSSKKPVLYSARIASALAALVEGVAAFDRQVGEHGAGGDALQAVDADVADRERSGAARRGLGCRLGVAAPRENGLAVCASAGSAGAGKRRGKGEGKQAAGGGSRHRYVRLGVGPSRARRWRVAGRARWRIGSGSSCRISL